MKMVLGIAVLSALLLGGFALHGRTSPEIVPAVAKKDEDMPLRKGRPAADCHWFQPSGGRPLRVRCAGQNAARDINAAGGQAFRGNARAAA